jgi:hypothetical protein
MARNYWANGTDWLNGPNRHNRANGTDWFNRPNGLNWTDGVYRTHWFNGCDRR